MVICVSMLVGSTFAWFTDSATANINAIKSGDLDVEIVKADGSELTGALKWVKAAGHENETILWEPGCQYNLEGFKIINKGNLAFKYKVVISGLTGDSRLLEVIKFTVKIGDAAPVALEDWDGKLLPTGAERTGDTQDADIGETAAITIIGEMDKNAGNDYKNLTLDGIKITVYATQVGYESDSKNNTYDEGATYYPVIDEAGLKDALKAGGDISVEKDVPTSGNDTLGARTIITKPTNLNLKGKIVSPDNMGNNSTNFTALMVAADTTIDAAANGGIDTGVNGGYAINVLSGAKLTINSGYYYGGGTAVQVQKGELVINGGFFAVEPYSDPTYGYNFLLNCIDAAHKDGTAKITVKGGTFVNFNPADCKAEGAGTNFVAEGYTVISETQANGDVWYTVVEGTGVSSNEELNNVISSATEPTTVTLGKGTYTLPSLDNKDITIKGTKDTVIDLSTGAAHHGATIALDGVTVKGQTSGDFEGLQHTEKVIYKNCTIVGKQTLYANDVEFIGCKFSSGTDYALWTYGAKNVTFTECEFESGNNSKSVLCYSVLSNQTFTRTFNKCTFTATGTADKSAIMINPTESGGGTNTYIININDCTATGYAENGIAGQTVVGLRNAGAGVIDTIKVNINGTTVYTH